MQEILVSVIVPTYKRKPSFLKRTVDSLLNQSYKNIEIIIVNDNPPDSDYKSEINNFIEQEYKQFNNIVLIDNPVNLGGSLARNKGIEAANGEYITFLDDDDIYLTEKIEKQLEFMIKENLDLSFADLIIKNEDEKIIDYREFSKLSNFETNNLLRYHLTRHITGTPTFMYKKEKLMEIGGFEKVIMGQEFFLMLRSIEKNLNIGYFAQAHVVAYRHSSESISVGKNKIIGEKYLYDYKKRYFHLFNNNEKKFIKFRHYAVMAVANKRDGKILDSAKNVFKMIITSPQDVMAETFGFITKQKRMVGKLK